MSAHEDTFPAVNEIHAQVVVRHLGHLFEGESVLVENSFGCERSLRSSRVYLLVFWCWGLGGVGQGTLSPDTRAR